jgi:hypothetical protein
MLKDKKRLTIIIISLLVLLSAAAVALQKLSPAAEGLSAVVALDGEQMLEIPLTKPQQLTEIKLHEQLGVDIVLEYGGDKIRFKSSSCPDKICINTGWLYRDMDIAVCMPNRTSVVIMPSEQVKIK